MQRLILFGCACVCFSIVSLVPATTLAAPRLRCGECHTWADRCLSNVSGYGSAAEKARQKCYEQERQCRRTCIKK